MLIFLGVSSSLVVNVDDFPPNNSFDIGVAANHVLPARPASGKQEKPAMNKGTPPKATTPKIRLPMNETGCNHQFFFEGLF